MHALHMDRMRQRESGVIAEADDGGPQDGERRDGAQQQQQRQHGAGPNQDQIKGLGAVHLQQVGSHV